MSFDDIPEDREQSFPCPEPGCDGCVTLIDGFWQCDTCDFIRKESK